MRLAAAIALSTTLAISPATVAAQAPPRDMAVTRTWLRTRLADTGLVLIHVVSDRAEYEAGHIPGSVAMPVSAFAVVSADSLRSELPAPEALRETLAAAGVADGRRIVVIGQPIPAARFVFTLAVAGLDPRVSLLDGGIEAWREDGSLPVSRSAETPRPRGTLTLSPQPGFVASVADVRAIAGGTGPARTKVLDARAVEFYTGASAGGMPRAGHVPTAGNVPITSLSGANGELRDPATIRRLIERAGAARGDSVVTYCHIGMQASLLWLQARRAGYAARVFDGSWQAWSRDPSLPLLTGPAK